MIEKDLRIFDLPLGLKIIEEYNNLNYAMYLKHSARRNSDKFLPYPRINLRSLG